MSESILDAHKDDICAGLLAGKSYTEIAKRLSDHGTPTTRHSVRRFVERHDLNNVVRDSIDAEEPGESGFSESGDYAEATSEQSEVIITPEQLVERFNVSLDDYEITHKQVNAYNYSEHRKPT